MAKALMPASGPWLKDTAMLGKLSVQWRIAIEKLFCHISNVMTAYWYAYPSVATAVHIVPIDIKKLLHWCRKANWPTLKIPTHQCQCLEMERNPGGMSLEDEFAVVLETAVLNVVELTAYCRGKGLFVEQVDCRPPCFRMCQIC